MSSKRWKVPTHIVHGATSNPRLIDPEIRVPSLESLLRNLEMIENVQDDLLPDSVDGVCWF